MKFVLAFTVFIGIGFVMLSIYFHILKKGCNREITGVYSRVNEYKSYGGNGTSTTKYAPVFRYHFEGNAYEQQTFQCFSGKYIAKNFVAGENYPIFINERKPERFVVHKRVEFRNIFMCLTGFFFMILGELGFLA